jgi:hypothetical protein
VTTAGIYFIRTVKYNPSLYKRNAEIMRKLQNAYITEFVEQIHIYVTNSKQESKKTLKYTPKGRNKKFGKTLV